MRKVRVEAYRLRKNFYEVALFLPHEITPNKYFYSKEILSNNYFLYVFRLKADNKKDAIYKIVNLYL